MDRFWPLPNGEETKYNQAPDEFKKDAEKTLEYYFTSSITIFYPIFVFKDVFFRKFFPYVWLVARSGM